MDVDEQLQRCVVAGPLTIEPEWIAQPDVWPEEDRDAVHPSSNSNCKWLIDKLGAAVLLVTLSPVMLLAALAIKLTSRGPVVFKGERIGHRNDLITMYKFRTMRVEVSTDDAVVADNDSVFVKVNGHDLVTPIGRHLRRLSIDELPQLVNVLKGDLSLVGPRPIQMKEAEHLPRGLRDPRFDVAQGITGLWQVSGRSDLPDEVRIALDHEYVENWSLGLDLRILLRTVRAVLWARGAR